MAPPWGRFIDNLTVGQVAKLLANPETHPERLSYPAPDVWRQLCSLLASLTQ